MDTQPKQNQYHRSKDASAIQARIMSGLAKLIYGKEAADMPAHLRREVLTTAPLRPGGSKRMRGGGGGEGEGE